MLTFIGFLAVVAAIAIVAIRFWVVTSTNSQIEEVISRGVSEERAAEYRRNTKEFGSSFKIGTVALGFVGSIILMFNSLFFYAEPGYWYHVRTITGQENIVDDTGYNLYLFGRYEPWKKAVTVQANDDNMNSATRNLKPINLTFLDQVDMTAHATARYLLPTDTENRFKIAREYRTLDNYMNTSLVPTFQETLQANANLMGAEEYYSGGRTEFNNMFEYQMKNGVYVVTREEVNVKVDQVYGSANAAKKTEQELYGDEFKKEFQVNIKYRNDEPITKKQAFTVYGTQLVEARITDMIPNAAFRDRMTLKQKASADRAIAREQRIQEEEQKLLAQTRGEREVAEQQAKVLVEQIEQTTRAETEKQLALTKANKMLEQAEIEKQTAQVYFEKSEIDAQTQVVLADAAAYERQALLEADNALKMKLDTEVDIQRVWADAYSKRNVPQYVFGSGGVGGPSTGSDSEVKTFMDLMTMQAAKSLQYDRSVDAEIK